MAEYIVQYASAPQFVCLLRAWTAFFVAEQDNRAKVNF